MTRFLFLDEVYNDAWAAGPHSTLDEWMNWSFGTSNFWDIALRAAGHESETHVLNFDPHWKVKVASYCPDVLVSQNLSVWGAYEGSPLSELRRFNPKIKLVGMCSYKCDDHVKEGWNVLFSSFNWMPDHCKSLGVRCEYLPLAFGRPVLDRIGELPKERDIPVAFIGGLGSRIWEHGTKTMAAIAEHVPEFVWIGYQAGDVPESLRRVHRPAVYGLEYYRTLARTQVALNRHGEIAKLWGNNMRQFEATGMGCMLLTDHAGELVGKTYKYPSVVGHEFCATYSSAEEAIKSIRHYINPRGAVIGGSAPGRSQEFVLTNHTYEARVPEFLRIVESL